MADKEVTKQLNEIVRVSGELSDQLDAIKANPFIEDRITGLVLMQQEAMGMIQRLAMAMLKKGK